MPLPETKHGAADNMEDGEAAEEQVEEESRDDDETEEAPRGHMHPQL